MDIEHIDHIMDMRRNQVMIESEFPTELADLFISLEDDPSGLERALHTKAKQLIQEAHKEEAWKTLLAFNER